MKKADPMTELLEFEAWCQDEDLRLRREAENNPELAALLADADAEYERRYGHPWVNPKAVA